MPLAEIPGLEDDARADVHHVTQDIGCTLRQPSLSRAATFVNPPDYLSAAATNDDINPPSRSNRKSAVISPANAAIQPIGA